MNHRTIIAVDVDGTLTDSVCFTNEEVRNAKPLAGALERVAELYSTGFVVVYTARRDELMQETIKWLKRHGIRYHAISNIKIPFDKYYDNDAEKL